MPQLFSLPKQVAHSSSDLPNARLYFFATGTSTPQNTYQDEALTTPHANPVVADSSGVFAPIYFDGSLPSYRVRLSDQNDVQIYQVDGIPSAQTTAQSYRLESVTPNLVFDETDASSGNQKWRLIAQGERWMLQVGNDAESVWTNSFEITRAGDSTISALNFTGTEIELTGQGAASGFSGAMTHNSGFYFNFNSNNHVQVETSRTTGNLNLAAPTGGTVTVTVGGVIATSCTDGIFRARGQLRYDGIISPAQITANTDDYAPTGLSTATALRLSTDASRNLTGITGGANGRVLLIFNVGAQDLVLINDSTSTAANRFLLGGNITLQANESIELWYDATSSRWRASGRHN